MDCSAIQSSDGFTLLSVCDRAMFAECQKGKRGILKRGVRPSKSATLRLKFDAIGTSLHSKSPSPPSAILPPANPVHRISPDSPPSSSGEIKGLNLTASVQQDPRRPLSSIGDDKSSNDKSSSGKNQRCLSPHPAYAFSSTRGTEPLGHASELAFQRSSSDNSIVVMGAHDTRSLKSSLGSFTSSSLANRPTETPPGHPGAFEDMSFKGGLAPLRAPASASLPDLPFGLPVFAPQWLPALSAPFRPIDVNDDAPSPP